jgi:tetratricopeptide (TPR) repeat protein
MKQDIREVQTLALDRDPSSPEIFSWNEWYGHARALRRYAGYPDDYPIKAVIEHGLKLIEKLEIWEAQAELPAMFVLAPYRYEFVRPYTNKACFSIGSSLLYSEHALTEGELASERSRLGKNLLAMPVHSTHHVNAEMNLELYCQSLKELGKHFDSVQVCLYWKDINRGWIDLFVKHGFEVVTAGHMFDPDFLLRLKSILDGATVVSTNWLGTNIGYALQMNKPVWYEEPPEFQMSQDEAGETEVFNKMTGTDVEGELGEELKLALRGQPTAVTEAQRELMNRFWGVNEKRTPEEMRQLFELTEYLYSKGRQFFMSAPHLLEDAAVHALNSGQPSAALLALNEAKRQTPENSEIDYGRAVALLQLDQTASAQAALQELLEGTPEHVKGRQLLEEHFPNTTPDKAALIESALKSSGDEASKAAKIIQQAIASPQPVSQELPVRPAAIFLSTPGAATASIKHALKTICAHSDLQLFDREAYIEGREADSSTRYVYSTHSLDNLPTLEQLEGCKILLCLQDPRDVAVSNIRELKHAPGTRSWMRQGWAQELADIADRPYDDLVLELVDLYRDRFCLDLKRAIESVGEVQTCYASYALLVYDTPLWISTVSEFLGVQLPEEAIQTLISGTLSDTSSERSDKQGEILYPELPGGYQLHLMKSTAQKLSREMNDALYWLREKEHPSLLSKHPDLY